MKQPPPSPLGRAAPATLLLPVVLSACSAPERSDAAVPRPDVPATRTVEVVDDYHGTQVADPYRWLEDLDGDDTAAWVAAQNRVTEAFLAGIDARAVLRERVAQLWNHARYAPPERAGDWWFYRKNDGLQNQAVLYKTRSPDDEGSMLLDPNTMSTDGTVAVGQLVPSHDGALAAYSVATAGSDWVEWHVIDVASGERRSDVLRWSKFGTAAWLRDGSGFFYTRYPEPEEGEALEAVNKQPQLCFHELGTHQANDAVVYERPDQPTWIFYGDTTEDGRYLVIHIAEGTDPRNRLAYVDLEDQERRVRPLLMDFDAEYAFVGAIESRFFIVTDRDAPRKRLVAIDLDEPSAEDWIEVIPERTDTLADARIVADRLVVTYNHDAHHLLRVHALDGAPLTEIDLPTLGSVSGMTGERHDTRAFFSFASFTTPPTVYRYDFDGGDLAVWRRPDLPFDASKIVTEQVFFQSEDGARIPMFLVHRADLRLSGDNPTLLYGYGGFNISLSPRFSVQTAVWLERGGIFAQPSLRGGGEYGEAWHRAGMLENKQNVFDDFFAAARYLTRNGYTRPDRLAITGRSNGGLLVGACLTQEPQLFGAAIPEVGVLDMLRYHRFTIGWAWVPEYGSSEDPEMFEVLHGYSPLHRIEDGRHYPATLIMTGDHDDRVMPAHSYKFAAALQSAQRGPEPILIRIETRAGHGAGTPTDKRIDAATDRLAFLTWALDFPEPR